MAVLSAGVDVVVLVGVVVVVVVVVVVGDAVVVVVEELDGDEVDEDDDGLEEGRLNTIDRCGRGSACHTNLSWSLSDKNIVVVVGQKHKFGPSHYGP